MSMNITINQQMDLGDSKPMDVKPYPNLGNNYNYGFDYHHHYGSMTESNFTPTSPTFPQYTQAYPPRLQGYNTYSSDHLMSPMRSPTTPAFINFNDYPRPSGPLTIQTNFANTGFQQRHMLRDMAPAPINPATDLMPLPSPYPGYHPNPGPSNDQIRFLKQNPQYLSGLAGQAIGSTSKVSRAIAAQLFARDETTDRFPCAMCGQTFKRINGLKRHLMMHLHIKPYKCDLCKRGFCRIDVYKRHVQRARCVKE